MRVKTAQGFTLLELVITLFILAILTLGAMPLVQVAIQRQREAQLREALREMRGAIDQFRRDVIGGPCAPAAGAAQGPQQPNQAPGQQGGAAAQIDPRSRVMITDCTIFSVDNPDRYPPDLETLVKGVNVAPRAGAGNQMGGVGLGNDTRNATDVSGTLATKKKVYLREIPIDPMTGRREWDLRSLYDTGDTSSWGGENVFDVRSQSKATALNGEKYNEW
ncbi:MAG TPA: type II secretion system protein [Pyrinomonadaceae bacterium]|nr:type II secretion system protein [Pyrinomonadaceae bacterium]